MIYNEDCLDTMSRIENDSVALIITSPPYNKGYWSSNRNLNNGFKTKSRRIEYDGYNDCIDPSEYNEWQRRVITECLRILKPDGSLFYNHQPIQKNHTEINPTYVYDFPLKQTIIWNRKNTPKLDKSYFYPVHEYIFWIKKTPTARPLFNRSSAMEKKSIWPFNPAKKNDHPAPFPEDLVENIVNACSMPGDIVYDPFAGSGTTLKVANSLGRQSFGSDVGESYCKSFNNQ
jgi:modification methylase